MAIYLRIVKVHESSAQADYEFMDASEERIGRLRVDKKTGESSLIKNMPGDPDDRMFLRAAYKLKKQFDSGVLPDLTVFAA